MGVTPGQAVPDISPVKDDDPRRANGIDRTVMSSSPPPMDGSGSPSKPGRSSQVPSSAVAKREGTAGTSADGDVEMRSRSASAAATSKPEVNASVAPIEFNANANGKAHQKNKSVNASGLDEDEADAEEGGFDLAKGFAPITGLRRQGSVNAR